MNFEFLFVGNALSQKRLGSAGHEKKRYSLTEVSIANRAAKLGFQYVAFSAGQPAKAGVIQVRGQNQRRSIGCFEAYKQVSVFIWLARQAQFRADFLAFRCNEIFMIGGGGAAHQALGNVGQKIHSVRRNSAPAASAKRNPLGVS